MKKILLVLLICLSNFKLEADRLGKDPSDYSYTSLGLKLTSQNEDFNVGIIGSLALPGPLYATFSQTAIGLEEDTYNEVSFDQQIRSINIGAHVGIGDLLNTVSVGSVSLDLENFMDVFFELGVKQYSFESSTNFDESFGNILFGARFGDANGWEGKFYIDLAKEVENYGVAIPGDCEEDDVVCIQGGEPVASVEFSDDRDLKIGFDFQFNLTRRLNVVLGFKTSEYLETEASMSLGIQY